jgi:two-component system cell cycle response regulator DivK
MIQVLIVDDNSAHLRLAATLLEYAGYAVLEAGDAEAGMALAREKRPDLVLMDIQLPGMDGFAATRLLKADPRTAPIPVLAMTSYLAGHLPADARAAGCAGFIAKPWHYKKFLEAVEKALGSAARPAGATPDV